MSRDAFIDISDTFTKWLGFANAGMLNRGNLYCFDTAIAGLPADTSVVEIGSFAGLSTNLLVYYLRRHGRDNRLFTCDRWEFEGARPGERIGEGPVTFDEYRAFVRESFLRNVRFFSGDRLPHTLEMNADEFFEAWSREAGAIDVFGRPVTLGGPIGFCYIDGNHSYACARRDFENADAFLVPGGFILFDDSADGTPWEVCRVVAEVAADAGYELVARNPNYLFRKR